MLFALDGNEAVQKEVLRYDISLVADKLKEGAQITDEDVSDAFEKLSEQANIVAIDIWETLLINDGGECIPRDGALDLLRELREKGYIVVLWTDSPMWSIEAGAYDTVLGVSSNILIREGNFSGFKDIRQIHGTALLDDMLHTSEIYAENGIAGFIHTPFNWTEFGIDKSSQLLDVKTILSDVKGLL